MISYVLAVIVFAGLGAAAFFGYKTSMELADKIESMRRRDMAPAPAKGATKAAAAAETTVSS